jgi:hypothetical protein
MKKLNMGVRSIKSRFYGEDIEMTVKLIDKIEKPIKILYYLMNQQSEESFVVILLSAQNLDLYQILMQEKRETDMIFEVDKESSLYAVICQDTKVDGGYYYFDRATKAIFANGGEEIYSTIIGVKKPNYPIEGIALKLIETFSKARKDSHSLENIFDILP